MNELSPSLSLKERQRQEREALILQATEDVLLEKGYHALSMDEIAARVGIAKGTLYLHFARKDLLVLQLLQRDLQNVMHTLDEATTTEGNARTKLTFLLTSIYQGLFGRRGQLLYILYNSEELQALVREKREELVHQVADRIAALLNEGKIAGEFEQSIPTDVMVSIFFSMLSPRAYRYLTHEQKLPPDELARYVERVYFGGIASHPAT